MADDPMNLARAYAENVAKLPTPPPKKKGLSLDTEEICVCGKHIRIDSGKLTMVDTGLFRTVNNVCKGCVNGAEIDKAHARLVCARCKKVLAHPEPMEDPKTHFRMEAGRCYHTDGCALCSPAEGGAEAEYPIIEAILWMRRRTNKN